MMSQKESPRNHPGITHHFLLAISSISALPRNNNRRTGEGNHPSLTINLELGTHAKQAPFLGIAHGWFQDDSFCDIINGA